LVDGTDPVTCSASPGTTFPIGTTTVDCSSTDSADNTADASFTVTVVADKADLKVSISGPSSAKAGSKVTYTMTVTNAGPASATDLTALLGTSGLTGVSAGPSTKVASLKIAGLALSGATWSLPSLGSGQSATFSLTGTAPTKAGASVTALGTASSTTPDPDQLNNISTAKTTIA
jgi:hypothetical protein